MHGLFEQVAEASEAVRRRWPATPRLGLILGTGLGGFSARVDAEVRIAYSDIPHFAPSTSPSHAGQLLCGRLSGQPLVVMEGRQHFYEGYSMRQVTFPVRLLKSLGAELLIITNAAGGLNPEFALGDVMIIDDHINLMTENPLRGVNDERLGPRFPDLIAPYDFDLCQRAKRAAIELKVPIQNGVLVAVPGPNLERQAEYRMLRMFGADAVSMSTVPEAIVAVHAGLKTLGFSIITDLCLPNALEPVKLERILEVAAKGAAHLERLIPRIVEQLDHLE